MKRFYAPPEQFQAEAVTLSTEETRHLRDVLRLKVGDEVQVFDGDGREFVCMIADIRKSGAGLSVLRETEPAAPESGLSLTLAAAIYKNDKIDLVVQKAVELGVKHFIPLMAFRSELKIRDTVKRTERWRKIALEATKQCERARVMTIDEITPFEDLVASSEAGGATLLMFSEKGGAGIPTKTLHKNITALVGPKGGWEDSEIELASGRGFLPVKLGRRIMRAETAAITFAALLQHRFGDLN
jgi:16S rRNA (uracil1498-N3)-methyltransferase